MSAETFGPYRIGELLGRGGMGQVHKAYDTVHERTVALKRLTEPYVADEAYRARFRRESQIVARLREPHVIPIHGFGEIDGRLYLDMRLVEGTDLKAVTRGGPLPPRRALALTGQVASALDAAHADGLVHRDVKPSNVLVTPGDFVYLVDFGIARGMGPDVTSITLSGDVVGTLDYMAPERFGDAPVDGRVDVYALACVLYACLTGRRPFLATDPAGQVRAHLQEIPPPPSTVNKSLPRGLDDVLLRGMAKEADQRFQTASAMTAAAEAVLNGGTSTVAGTTGWAPGPGGPTQQGLAQQGPTQQGLAQQGPTQPAQQRPHTRMLTGVPTPTGLYPGPPTGYHQGGPPSGPTPTHSPTGYGPIPMPTGLGPLPPGIPPQRPPSHRGTWIATAALVLVVAIVATVLIATRPNTNTDASGGNGGTTTSTTTPSHNTTTTHHTTTTTTAPSVTLPSSTTPSGGTSGANQKLLDALPVVYRGSDSCEPDTDTEQTAAANTILAAVGCTDPNQEDPFATAPDSAEFASFSDLGTLEEGWQSVVHNNDLSLNDNLGGCKPQVQANTYGLYYRPDRKQSDEYQSCFVTVAKDGTHYGEVWWMDTKNLYIGALLSKDDNTVSSLSDLDSWWDDMILSHMGQ